jgi:type IV pilus assembly protein PilW
MNSTPFSRQTGLSLIELMIAITLSILLMVGVLQVFLTSKQTYSTNNALSRVQESGRFAIDFLTYDIRNAGYKGECTGAPNILLDETNGAYNTDLFDLSNAIKGWENPAVNTPAWVTAPTKANGDIIIVKHAANASGSTASGNTPANANTINLTGASSIAEGTIIIVSDPLGCDIFQNRSNDNANNITRGNTGIPGNKNPGSFNFSHTFNNSMEILTLQSATYYIGNGANGLPALRRISYPIGTGAGAVLNEELVDGIQDMQILYGIADANRQVTSYVAANNGWGVADWAKIVSVQINLLAVSAESNVIEGANQVISFNGANVTISNRRLAKVFTTTIGIRNRLP